MHAMYFKVHVIACCLSFSVCRMSIAVSHLCPPIAIYDQVINLYSHVAIQTNLRRSFLVAFLFSNRQTPIRLTVHLKHEFWLQSYEWRSDVFPIEIKVFEHTHYIQETELRFVPNANNNQRVNTCRSAPAIWAEKHCISTGTPQEVSVCVSVCMCLDFVWSLVKQDSNDSFS